MARTNERSFRAQLTTQARRSWRRAFNMNGVASNDGARAVAKMMESAVAWLTDSLGNLGTYINPNSFFELLSRNGQLLPDGWTQTAGNIEAVELVEADSGTRGIQYTGDGTNASFLGPKFPIHTDERIIARVRYNSSDAATATVAAAIVMTDKDGVTLATITIISAKVPTAAATFENNFSTFAVPTANVRFGQLQVTLSAPSTETIILERATVERNESGPNAYAHTAFDVSLIANQTVANLVVTTKVLFATEAYDAGQNFDVTSSEYTAPESGLYDFFANVQVTGIAAGTQPLIELQVDSGGGFVTVGEAIEEPANVPHTMQITKLGLQLSKDDVVRVLISGDANGWTIVGSAGGEETYFSGVKRMEQFV